MLPVHRKKKKKKDKSDRSTSPTLQKKTSSRLDAFVERTLDFGHRSASSSPSPNTSALQHLYPSNRYVVLTSESNTSSVVDLTAYNSPASTPDSNLPNTTTTINTTNHTLSHSTLTRTSTPHSSHSPNTSIHSIYGTPTDLPQDSQPSVPPHIIPDFSAQLYIPVLTSSATVTTTSISSVSLITTTSLTYTHGTILHSTPNTSPPQDPHTSISKASFINTIPLPPPPPSPPTALTTGDFRSDYDSLLPKKDSITLSSQSLSTLNKPSTQPIKVIKTNSQPSNPPTLFPTVIIKQPPFTTISKRKRPKSPSDSQSSPDYSDKSIRKPTKQLPPTSELDRVELASPASPVNTTVQPQFPTSPPSAPATRPQAKPPAIHIYTQDNNTLMKNINQTASAIPTYKFNNTSLICFPASQSDHPRIIKFLNLNSVEYYTHDPINLRPVKLAVKYVPQDVPDSEILDDLRNKELPLIKLSRVMIQRQGKRVASNILILTVPKEAAQSYYSLSDICNLKVSVSDYQGPQINQCHNCQGFAHSSTMCGRLAKCLRCGQSHKGKQCATDEVKCANCEANHPANYRGCPAYQEALRRYASRSNLPTKQTLQHTHKTPNPTQHPEEFPPLKPSKPQQQPSQQPPPKSWPHSKDSSPPSDNPLKEIINLLKSFNLSHIWNLIKDTLAKIRQISDPVEKLLIIFETVINFFSNDA